MKKTLRGRIVGISKKEKGLNVSNRLTVKIFVYTLNRTFKWECYHDLLKRVNKKEMSVQMQDSIFSNKEAVVKLAVRKGQDVPKKYKDIYTLKLKGEELDKQRDALVFDPSILLSDYKLKTM